MSRAAVLIAAVLAVMLGPGSSIAAQSPGGQQQTPPATPPAQQPAPPAAGGAPQQQPAAPGAQPSKEAGAPLSRLGLSEDQKKQIHEIHKKTDQQVQEVRGNTSLTEPQQRQQIRQLRRNANQQVEGVLSAEQRDKYEAWRRAQRLRHRHQPPPPQPPAQ